MRYFKIFIILFIIIMTMYIAASTPTVHKQFVMAPTTFKLASANQVPKETQSTTLFKLFEINPDNMLSQATTTEENNILPAEEQISQEVTIIPSSFVTDTNHQSTQELNLYLEKERQKLELSNKLNSEAMQQYNNQIQANDLAKIRRQQNSDIKRRQSTISNKNNKTKNKSDSGDADLSSILAKLNEDVGYCPICDDLKNRNRNNPAARKRDAETIAWNAWHSRLQNEIMDISDVNDTPVGTIFSFSFDVDNNGNISKLSVDSNYPSANHRVVHAIKSLTRTAILKFPEGTKRKSVHFEGTFMMSHVTRHSTPNDFNDFEKLLR